MATIGSLIVELRTNTAKFQQGMDQANRRLNGFSRDVGRVKGLVAGALAAISFKTIIENTKVQEMAMRQLEQAVKSTGGVSGFTAKELASMAAELQNVTTFGDEAIISMQSILLTFTKIRDDVLPRTVEAILDLSARMGIDLNSAAIQLGKALNDPVANLSALSRAGIQFSDSQKALIKRMVDTNQLAKAQHVILDELETQFGGSARAARDTFGGALESLGNAFGDLLESNQMEDAKKSIEDLTKVLQDPKTVDAFNKLTSGLFSMIGLLSEAAIEFTYLADKIGFWAADIVTGVAELDKLEDKLKEIDRALSGAWIIPLKLKGLTTEELLLMRQVIIKQIKSITGEYAGATPVVKIKPTIDDENVKTFFQSTEEWANELADKSKRFVSVLNELYPEESAARKYLEDYKLLAEFLEGPELEAAIKQLNEKFSGKNDALKWSDAWKDAFDRFAAGIGDATATAILEQKKFSDVMRVIAKQVIHSIISGLVEIGVKKVALSLLAKKTMTADTVASVLAAKTTAIAWAPAAAAVSVATGGAAATAGGMALASTYALSQGLALSGVAHDGMSYIPQDGTYLLQKGEKVISNEDSKKLNMLLSGGAMGASVTVNIQAMDAAGVLRVLSTPTAKKQIENFALKTVDEQYKRRGSRGGPFG